MDEPDNFAVAKNDSGLRIDRFVARQMPLLSRSRLQTLIRTGHVRLGGCAVKPSERVREGDRVTVRVPPPAPVAIGAEPIPLRVLFEDGSLVVIDKPPGLVVHPGAGNREHTLVNALLHHCEDLSGIGGEERPGIVHRLDKETSGCVVVAKNDLAHANLARQFAGRHVLKIYLAWVDGKMRAARGRIDTPIARHPVERKRMAVARPGSGRAAITDYRVLAETPRRSLVECVLHTGRTHQIRVHLKHVGHPVLGDAVYGKRGGFPRQMLHAWRLGFSHPITGDWLEFASPWPEDFNALMPEPPEIRDWRNKLCRKNHSHAE